MTFHLFDKPVWREKALSAVDILSEAQGLTILRFRFSSQLHIKAILSNFGSHYCTDTPTKNENMHPFKKFLSILILHLELDSSMHKSTNTDLITFSAAPCEGQIHHPSRRHTFLCPCYAFHSLIITTENLLNLCQNNDLLLLFWQLCFSCLICSGWLSKRNFLSHQQPDRGAKTKQGFNWVLLNFHSRK